MLRVAFLGQSGPYSPVALRHVHAAAGRGYEIVIVVAGRSRSVHHPAHRLRKARAAALPDGSSLVNLARSMGYPVLETQDVNAPTAVATVSQFAPDMLVCVGYDRLFRRPLLEVGKRPGINAHPSALPALRGPSPLFWALRKGLRSSAVTLHLLDTGEDHGPIVAQERLVLAPRARGEEIFNAAGDLAGRMLALALAEAAVGNLSTRVQDHGCATRAPRPKAEDVRVEPGQWNAEHLVDFACGAPFFRSPWLRLGDDTYFVANGLQADLGRRLPAEYVLRGDRLVVQAKDGVVHLQIQV